MCINSTVRWIIASLFACHVAVPPVAVKMVCNQAMLFSHVMGHCHSTLPVFAEEGEEGRCWGEGYSGFCLLPGISGKKNKGWLVQQNK